MAAVTPLPSPAAGGSLPLTPPSFWLPVLAALPLVAVMLVMALPLLGHGAATVSRTLYLWAFLIWLLPLTWLQRALWRRGLPAWKLALWLVAATYLMVLATRVLAMVLQSHLAGLEATVVPWSLAWRGLEGPWLALVAYCALHAGVAYYAALANEQARVREARALTRDAELRALRYQLQPHFLFNSLNAISTLVGEGRSREAQQMLARLADFLRTTLEGSPGHEVSLADELSVTEAYLQIEKARLGDRLQLHWDIGPGVLDARVPSLLLQPLVENALRHGIAARTQAGRLDIGIHALGDSLTIRIANDLPDHAGVVAGPAGVGLGNLRERLALIHPGRYTLQAGVSAERRFEVEMGFPLRRGTEPAP